MSSGWETVAQPAPGQAPKRAWYFNGVVVAASLLFCFPVGLILMWAGRVWPVPVRVIVSCIFGLIVLGQMNKQGERTAGREPRAEVSAQVRAVAAAPQFISESCLDMANTFGAGSDLSDLQKEELWRRYDGRAFEWDLQITEVSSDTFGGFTVQAKCSPRSPSLIQDVMIKYEEGAKQVVMQLRKGRSYKLRGKLKLTSTLLGLSADALP